MTELQAIQKSIRHWEYIKKLLQKIIRFKWIVEDDYVYNTKGRLINELKYYSNSCACCKYANYESFGCFSCPAKKYTGKSCFNVGWNNFMWEDDNNSEERIKLSDQILDWLREAEENCRKERASAK